MPRDPAILNFPRDADFIPASSFPKISQTTVEGGAAGTAIGIDADAAEFNLTKAAATARTSLLPVKLVSPGAGNPEFGKVGSLSYTGFKMVDAGDRVNTGLIRIPRNWARKHPLRFRVVWACDSQDTADTILWKVRYGTDGLEDGRLASLSLTLTTPIVSQNIRTNGGGNMLLYGTEWGVLNQVVNEGHGFFLDPDDEFIMLDVEMESFDAGLSEDKWFLGLDIEYSPRYGNKPIQGEAPDWIVG